MTMEMEETEYEVPNWKAKLNRLTAQNTTKNIAYQDNTDYLIKEEEIALKHPSSGSIVKLTDDGYVDIFAGPALGIRLDPKTNSINFFGDSLNFIGKQVNIMSKPNGFCWNGYYFNPELYMENATERSPMLTGTKEYYHETHESDPEDRRVEWHRDAWGIQPMIRSSAKRRYSEGMTQLMKDLDLPIE